MGVTNNSKENKGNSVMLLHYLASAHLDELDSVRFFCLLTFMLFV